MPPMPSRPSLDHTTARISAISCAVAPEVEKPVRFDEIRARLLAQLVGSVSARRSAAPFPESL